MLDVDTRIIAFLRDNPGSNTGAVGRAIAQWYTPQYAKERLPVMAARGVLRCEVSGPPPRYKYFVIPRSEEEPEP